MSNDNTSFKALIRSLSILFYINIFIWMISIIALVFVIDKCPAAKGLFPILAGGVAVSILLLAKIRQHK